MALQIARGGDGLQGWIEVHAQRCLSFSGLHLCFLDIETTGFSPQKDRLIEVYCSAVSPEGEVSELYALVNPGVPILNGRIHGLYDRHVRGKPPFEEVALKLHAFLKGKVPVAHNGDRFDVPFLQAGLDRAGITWEPGRTVDTMRLASKAWHSKEKGAHKLETLARRFEIPTPDAHSARGDVETLRKLWEHLRPAVEGRCDE